MLHQPTAHPALVPHPPRHTALVDENGLVDWLIDAKPGDRIVYYRGHLAHDRAPSAQVMDSRSRAVVHTVASRVMASTEKGLVLPVQKRIGPGDYLYIAVKALPPRAAERRSQLSPLSIGSRLAPINTAPAMPAPLAA